MKRFLILALLSVLLASCAVWAQEVSGPVFVSDPVVPSLTPAIRDLPTFVPDPNLFGLEAKRRDDHGIIVPDIDMPPHFNPLAEMQSQAPAPAPSAFGTPFVNFAGVTSSTSPPDDTGDVGPSHFLQGDNASGGSRLTIYNKTGTQQAQFLMETLGSSPCNQGYCDPIVQYDQLADRWMISEFDLSANTLCVYVSRTSDPLGQWWAYSFDMTSQGGMQDYPKYGVWPDGYYIGVNNGGYIHVLDRVKMLAGLAATSQSFIITTLSGFSFQLTVPGTVEGVAPPAGAPGLFVRPVDTEIHTGYSCTSEPCDVMDIWAVHVDWTTPASSTLTHLPGVKIDEFDHTLCGTGNTWDCMPQPGTTQKIDPIREPLHYPLQYRNWGTYETLVGAFVEDVDGTDHAAVHWFELRKASGTWAKYQEGVLGGEAGIHRSVAGAAMDGSGNIAVGYTRTGTTAPYYPSIYYSGRLATDPLGTMPYYDNMIFNATTSNTDNERWGDYAGIGVDPADDCSFWFTTEYGGSGQTRIAAFKFDACGCVSVPAAPVATISAPSNNRIDVGWNDSATASITQYFVYRSLTPGGPYTLLATVADTSPGFGGGAPYIYHDDTVSGGTTYYYTVKSNDGVACTSPASNEVSIAATGLCILPPSFAGLASVTNPAGATCTLNLAWSTGAAACAGPLTYNVYRSTTTGFTPGPSNRIAPNLSATSYSDLDNLVSGTTYYYIVRAVDSSNGAEDTNLVVQSGVPTGFLTTGTWTDDGGDTGTAKLALQSTWNVANTGGNSGPKCYATGTYGNSVCISATTPTLNVGTGGGTLTFSSKYDIESGWDKGLVEISTNGGSSYSRLEVTTYPDSSSRASDACGFPRSATYFSRTITSPTYASYTAAVPAGSAIQIRWRLSTDSSLTKTGWWIDDISVTNVQVPGSCATGSAAPGETAPGDTFATAQSWTNKTTQTWPANAIATSYTLYRGIQSDLPQLLNSSTDSCTKYTGAGTSTATITEDPTGIAGGFYWYLVTGSNTGGEGPAGNATAGARTVNSSGTCP